MSKLTKRLDALEKQNRPNDDHKPFPIRWTRPEGDPDEWYVSAEKMDELERQIAGMVRGEQ